MQDFPESGELWHNEELVSDRMYLTIEVLNGHENEGWYVVVDTEEGEPASIIFVRFSLYSWGSTC